jgi:hypothetical protein
MMWLWHHDGTKRSSLAGITPAQRGGAPADPIANLDSFRWLNTATASFKPPSPLEWYFATHTIFGGVKDAHLPYGSQPWSRDDMQVRHVRDGRVVFFADLDGPQRGSAKRRLSQHGIGRYLEMRDAPTSASNLVATFRIRRRLFQRMVEFLLCRHALILEDPQPQ